jgi:hypothetical protein
MTMFTWVYTKKCETTRLSGAIQRRFPAWKGSTEAKGNEIAIRVMGGITESEKPTVDQIVSRHIADWQQARTEYDATSSIGDTAQRIDAQLSVIARFFNLADI